MAKKTTKAEQIQDTLAEYKRLGDTLALLSDEDMVQAGVIGEWSPKDVLAHVIEWQQMFLGWYQAGLRGETPRTPAPDLNWGQLDVLNHRIFEKHKDRPLADIRADFEASHRQIISTLEAMTEEAMLTPGCYAWTGKHALIGYISPCTSGHYLWAKKEIRRWMRAQGKL